MPRKRQWIRTVQDILEDVEAIPSQVFDRESVESLFGLRRHAAAALMRDMGADLIGNALWLERKKLLLYLNKVASDHDSALERRRVVRLGESITEAKKFLEARRISIRVEPWVDKLQIRDLPKGVTITKDKIVIDYFGTEDAIRQLFELSKAIANDYTAFEKIAEGL